MTDELFADRIAEIHLTGSVIRLDLASISTTDRDPNNQPRLEFRRRVVMPIEGFMYSYSLMTQLVQELESKGLIRRTEAPPPASGTDARPTPAPGPASPNFR
ncbi:MAG: hypothetical protein AB7Q97_02930 [Gammaproteobacteria bacterium]